MSKTKIRPRNETRVSAAQCRFKFNASDRIEVSCLLLVCRMRCWLCLRVRVEMIWCKQNIKWKEANARTVRKSDADSAPRPFFCWFPFRAFSFHTRRSRRRFLLSFHLCEFFCRATARLILFMVGSWPYNTKNSAMHIAVPGEWWIFDILWTNCGCENIILLCSSPLRYGYAILNRFISIQLFIYPFPTA